MKFHSFKKVLYEIESAFKKIWNSLKRIAKYCMCEESTIWFSDLDTSMNTSNWN